MAWRAPFLGPLSAALSRSLMLGRAGVSSYSRAGLVAILPILHFLGEGEKWRRKEGNDSRSRRLRVDIRSTAAVSFYRISRANNRDQLSKITENNPGYSSCHVVVERTWWKENPR